MNTEELQACARQACTLLKSIGNEHRLSILCELVRGERSVGELVRLVGLSQSALSQHLARLRRDNLVRTRREAQTIHYSLASDEALAVLDRLHALYCSGQQQPRVGGHAEEHGSRGGVAAAHP